MAAMAPSGDAGSPSAGAACVLGKTREVHMPESNEISAQPDGAKLEAFVGRMLDDMGATMSASLALIGDKLGLYKALAAAGPLSSAELAERIWTNERMVREWLAAQAA